MFSIYVHVPFCAKVCDYCDFHVMPAVEKLYGEYADLLCREVELFEISHPGLLKTAETLYLGGGTPSILPSENLRAIFACLESFGVKIRDLREVSMEFNPESTSEASIDCARGLGVTRFSLGLQTFDADLLKRIGRSHSVEAGIQALELLTSTDARVSADLMFDLPGQTVKSFLDDVDRLSDFPLNHVSFYGLTVSPRTILGQRVKRGVLSIDEDVYEDMYLGGVQVLEGKGIKRYEVSNFARAGFESVHNQNYWNRGQYAGFGPGAHSYVGDSRFYAPEIYPRWRDYVRAGAPASMIEVDKLNRDDVLMELIWLSLRQSSGLDLKSLEPLGVRLDVSQCMPWIEKDFLRLEGSVLSLNGRGWIFMDEIVTNLASSYSNME